MMSSLCHLRIILRKRSDQKHTVFWSDQRLMADDVFLRHDDRKAERLSLLRVSNLKLSLI